MTINKGSSRLLNGMLLLTAIVGGGLFVWREARTQAPLLRLTLFRQRPLSAGFAMSALVTAVVMATLVVGPFYLASAFELDAARVGLVMSSGPLVATLSGLPAGRLVDRFGPQRMAVAGLVAMRLGAFTLPRLSAGLGLPGYVSALAFSVAGAFVLTALVIAVRSSAAA
ncbi:hypothetical protein [Thauera sp. WH-1]|uniref:hypothetical protein n=1 Tax=Thauera sp. WH-1 TaxID=3398230 RepID=UPI0039FDD7A1